MQKYLYLLKFELKNIFRDRMTLFMLFYPVMMLLLSTVLIPSLIKGADHESPAVMYGAIITFVVLISMTTFIVGALLAFVLVDRKDENTLQTISATPLSVGGYIRFQAVYHYVITVIMNLLVLIGTKLIAGEAYSYTINGITVNIFNNLTYLKIVVFSFVSAMYMPAVGYLLGSLGKNKIESFAYMKMSGILALIPVLVILEAFSGGMQYIIGIAPNFWSVKGLLVSVLPYGNPADLSFYWYMIISVAYSVIITPIAYKLFLKKAMRV